MKPKQQRTSAGQSSLHFGTISQVFPNGTARVRLEDMDGIETMPIPVTHQNTHGSSAPGQSPDRIWYWMPIVGQRVACLLDEKGEQGAIVGGIYTESNLPPLQDLNKFYFKFGAIEIEGDVTTGIIKVNCTRLEIVSTQPSTLQGKQIVVLGGGDDDSEGNGPDTIVQSGQ